MGKLRDLIQAEGERFRAERDKRKQTLREWQELLAGLFARIEGWLRDSDPEGLLEVERDTTTINDPALGEYEAPLLRVTLGDNAVEIVPRARYVISSIRPPGAPKPVRAHGLVEVREYGSVRYDLYQLPNDEWYIYNRARPLSAVDENPVDPLDAERLEAALAGLLR